MKSSLLLAVACLFFTSSVALAQEPIKPGKEHEFLRESVGEWNIKFDMADGSVNGTAVYKMVHGDLWLASDLEMPMPGAKFTGQGLDSYDPAKKKYVGIWVDSMITAPIVMEGDLAAIGSTKTLTMTGKGPGPDGKPADYKMKTDYKDKDTHVFRLWVGNVSGDPMMTATYTRKK